LHDFSAVPESPAPRIGRTTFRVATNAERCTNVNTFVVDLRVERDALWQRVRQNAKGACKKAESIGTRVALTRTPKRDEVDAFFRAYEVLAERKGLRVPDRRLIERMLADGALLFVHCRDADGRTLCMNLVYLAGETAFYLHGVGTERSKGEGQYVQWETIKHLQANGTMRWYDLGGVPSTDPKDGIFFFKRSMGGTLVPLGVEYIHVPALVARGLRYRARAQTAVKRLFFGSS
jgi:lipid II:glycine glycyltransferase (peptidoglycan interpeptide bridge formation enzyme)